MTSIFKAVYFDIPVYEEIFPVVLDEVNLLVLVELLRKVLYLDSLLYNLGIYLPWIRVNVVLLIRCLSDSQNLRFSGP